MGANGNINDLELAKFIELAGQYGIRIHILHGDSWLPSVANLAALPAAGNTTGDIRQLLDTGVPYRWSGSAWAVWSTSGVSWGAIAGTLSAQTDLQTALDAKMGSGAYVLVSRDSLLTNQINLGALTSGILKQTVEAGVATISILTDNSGNWDIAYTHSQIATGNPHGTTKADLSLGNVDNTSDANKPVSTAQATADTAALNAAKAYADGLVVGLLDDRGNFNASTNTWPSTGGSGTAGAILKGNLWTISVAGTLGGVPVTAGDVIRALIDTPGTTAANWAISENNFGYVAENSANKDASGGYAGLTLFKLNMRNAANSITSWFTNSNTAARTYTLPDKDGTVAMTSDIIGTNSGINTGDETATRIGALIGGADDATPNDTDFIATSLTAGGILKKITWTNTKAFLKTYFDTLYTKYLGDADFYKYSITTSVASGNLTVTLLNYAGATPSATAPVKIQIGGVIRTITSALTLTSNASQNYLNLGSAELATKEVDLFVYARWDTGANAVCLDVSRYPNATVTGDFVQSGLSEKGYLVSSFAGSAVTDVEVNIGRFNAILSAGAGYTWSIPATSVIINSPTFFTRTIQGGSQTGWTANNLLFYYTINGDRVEFSFDANGTSNSTSSYITLPFSARTIIAHDFALGLTYDNGVDLTTPGRADLYGQYCNLYKDSAYGAWTASGGKIIRGQGHYYI